MKRAAKGTVAVPVLEVDGDAMHRGRGLLPPTENAGLVRVAPGEVYAAHMGGSGDAGPVSATISVHAPTGRVVYQVVRPGVMRLGPPVSAFRERGYTVTPSGTPRAGR